MNGRFKQRQKHRFDNNEAYQLEYGLAEPEANAFFLPIIHTRMNHLADVYKKVSKLAKSDVSVEAGMRELCEFCNGLLADESWKALASIEYHKGVVQLEEWLRFLIHRDPPEKSVAAYYFGIFEPALGDGTASLDVALYGAPNYDANDDEWACWDDDGYTPQASAESPLLRQIAATLSGKPGNLQTLAGYALPLGFCCLALAEIFKTTDLGSALAAGKKRFVAVGFDEGDLLTFGFVAPGGWKTTLKPAA